MTKIDGGYAVFWKDKDGSLRRLFIPEDVKAEDLLEVAADMRPTPRVVPAPMRSKVSDVVRDGE